MFDKSVKVWMWESVWTVKLTFAQNVLTFSSTNIYLGNCNVIGIHFLAEYNMLWFVNITSEIQKSNTVDIQPPHKLVEESPK